MGKVVYLTGAPATGKSTLTEQIFRERPHTSIFTYSKELLECVKKRNATVTSQDDLRRESASIITHDDVKKVDEELLSLVNSSRDSQNIVIDSHPVTIEKFGFRVTPFTDRQIRELNPNVIVCLYADSEAIRERIKKNAAGRPLPSKFEVEMHMHVQSQIAVHYAFVASSRLFYLDTDKSQVEVLKNFMGVVGID